MRTPETESSFFVTLIFLFSEIEIEPKGAGRQAALFRFDGGATAPSFPARMNMS